MERTYYPVTPMGRYPAKLKQIRDSVSKSNKEPIKFLIFEIEYGAYSRNTILATFMTQRPKSMKLLNKVFSYLSNGSPFNNPEKLIGRSVGIVIMVKETGSMGLASMNSIKGYFPVH